MSKLPSRTLPALDGTAKRLRDMFDNAGAYTDAIRIQNEKECRERQLLAALDLIKRVRDYRADEGYHDDLQAEMHEMLEGEA